MQGGIKEETLKNCVDEKKGYCLHATEAWITWA